MTTPADPHRLVRVSIAKAAAAGRLAAYERVAVRRNETHLILPLAAIEAVRAGRPPGTLRRLLRGVADAGGGAASMIKTRLGIDRASDAKFQARLDVCRACPGNLAQLTVARKHVTPPTPQRRDELIAAGAEVHTCGPMLRQQKKDTGKSCGCVLREKARDLKQHCPNRWWPGD